MIKLFLSEGTDACLPSITLARQDDGQVELTLDELRSRLATWKAVRTLSMGVLQVLSANGFETGGHGHTPREAYTYIRARQEAAVR
jgi:hypothetical protein